jgi:hypothetical protein
MEPEAWIPEDCTVWVKKLILSLVYDGDGESLSSIVIDPYN